MPGALTECLRVCLQGQSQSVKRRAGVLLLCLLLCIDASVQVFLRMAPHIVAPHACAAADWDVIALNDELHDARNTTADCLLLFILRAAALAILVPLAVHVGTPSSSSEPTSTATAPLLINGAAVDPNAVPAPKAHLDFNRRKILADYRRNFVVAIVFACATMAQIYIGIKCITFEGAWATQAVQTAQGVMLGLTVLLINVEAFVATELVNELTAEEG